MFWKKKKVPFNILNPGENAEKRESFRYVFSNKHSLAIDFLGRQVLLMDLSAGGTSFKNDKFSPGDNDFVCINLDIPSMNFHTRISANIKINRIDEQEICYAYFENPDQLTKESIHRFLLEMQKKDLRFSRKIQMDSEQ